eukprot:404233-Pyramimonas_sp.AAC.1
MAAPPRMRSSTPRRAAQVAKREFLGLGRGEDLDESLQIVPRGRFEGGYCCRKIAPHRRCDSMWSP